MLFRGVARLGVLLALSLAVAGSVEAAGHHRSVEIRWDFRVDPPGQLEVWVDCMRAVGVDIYTCDDTKKIRPPASYAFHIDPSDQITLVVISAKTDDPGSATYAITGTNLSEKDLDALKKMFGADGAAKAAGTGGTQTLEVAKLPEPKADVKAVTDALTAGGKLTVTFSLKKTADGKDTTTKTSGPLTFNITPELPRYTVSFGLGFSTAPNPTVVISKTSTIVTFQKDGKTQQAYQQVIELQDDDTSLKPIQSLVTFANFRLVGPVYGSLGVQVNQKLFDGPILGGTYRIPIGTQHGVNITAGVHFSKENEIDSATGFAPGQLIDPTLGLTVADIRTKTVWHRRFALAFTMDF